MNYTIYDWFSYNIVMTDHSLKVCCMKDNIYKIRLFIDKYRLIMFNI